MLIDTHSHLNFKAFEKDFDKTINSCLKKGVWLINVGSNYETSVKAVEIAEKYKKGVFAAIGLHPIHSEKEKFNKKEYQKLSRSKKVIAIGEIGLDYYKEYGLFKEKQKEVLLRQLILAKELKLPVIFHCRMAHLDLIELLNLKNSKLKGVIHCFTGTKKEAKEYLKKGFYLGFNGIIYKLNLKDIIKEVPLEKILPETDCPYLTPPFLKKERNEPVFVKYIIEEIAKIKNLNFEIVKKITFKNAKELFKI